MHIKKKELKKLLKDTVPPRGSGKKSKKFYKENGFYYEDCWNLDVTIAHFILPRLIQLRKKTIAFPSGFESLEDWKATLDKMIEAFYLILKDPYSSKLNTSNAKIKEGLTLFAHFFQALWG